jgi:hypothetical protein
LCTASDVSQVGQIIVAGDFVYFTDGESTVYSCATGTNGATAATYTSVTQPGGLASDGTNLYWAENTSGSSSSSSTTGTGGASILTCALGATCAKPTTVVSGLDAVDGVAVTATTLYWTATDSAFNPELFYFKK